MRRTLIVPFMLLLTMATAAAELKYPAVPKFMTDITYKIDTEQGRGTGFAVDLSGFGLPGKSYMLTAAHVITNDRGETAKFIKIQTKEPSFKQRRWIKVDVVAMDVKLDIALLKCAMEFPALGAIAMEDLIEINDAVAAVGFPQGAPMATTFGFLGDKVFDVPSMLNESYWFAALAIFYGNSGGPVFDPNREQIIGVVVVCIGNDKGQAAPNACGFVSTPAMRKFIERTAKLKQAADAKTAQSR